MFLSSFSKILLVHLCKCCDLIGWAIANYQPLGWNDWKIVYKMETRFSKI